MLSSKVCECDSKILLNTPECIDDSKSVLKDIMESFKKLLTEEEILREVPEIKNKLKDLKLGDNIVSKSGTQRIVEKNDNNMLTLKVIKSNVYNESFSLKYLLDNISRLRISGDYSIDYENGKIYLATPSFGQDSFGSVSYRHNSIIARNKNIIAVTEASRKNKESDSV